MLCGSFSKCKMLRLNDVVRRTFIRALDIWCGRRSGQEVEFVRGRAASERGRPVSNHVSSLDEAVIGFCVAACGEMLMWSGGCVG